MFSTAFTIARDFTKPVVIAWVNDQGVCSSGLGTHVFVNSDGWVLTAWHIIQQLKDLEAAMVATKAYETEIDAILNNKALLPDQRRKKARQLAVPPLKVKNFAAWWGADPWKWERAEGVLGADLALVKLKDFDSAAVPRYPTFKDPSRDLVPGTGLCRLGFPFQEVKPTYDVATGGFNLGSVNFCFFPNEGILTRQLEVSDTPGDPNGRVAFIETSSPGLRGQSGGPIFDQQGTIWGIQSHTGHLDLGFSPPQPNGKPGNNILD